MTGFLVLIRVRFCDQAGWACMRLKQSDAYWLHDLLGLCDKMSIIFLKLVVIALSRMLSGYPPIILGVMISIALL